MPYLTSRPTWNNAIGGSTQGARRVHAPKQSISVKDILGNSEVKTRHFENPLESEDKNVLKRQLEAKESEAAKKRGKTEERDEKVVELDPNKALEWLRAHNPDAVVKREDGNDEDEDDERDNASDDSDDSDSDEEELLRELEKIKREREEEAVQQQRARVEEQRMEERDVAANSNPLMADQKVKKQWWQDTVFRGQAKDAGTQKKKEFVNDTIRSDFHRKFIDRFVK